MYPSQFFRLVVFGISLFASLSAFSENPLNSDEQICIDFFAHESSIKDKIDLRNLKERKKAYHEIALLYHPDKCSLPKEVCLRNWFFANNCMDRLIMINDSIKQNSTTDTKNTKMKDNEEMSETDFYFLDGLEKVKPNDRIFLRSLVINGGYEGHEVNNNVISVYTEWCTVNYYDHIDDILDFIKKYLEGKDGLIPQVTKLSTRGKQFIDAYLHNDGFSRYISHFMEGNKLVVKVKGMNEYFFNEDGMFIIKDFLDINSPGAKKLKDKH